MMMIQEAIQQSIEAGHLINAGWLILIVTLLLTIIGMAFAIYRREKFRYWRVISTMLILGLAAMSGLLDEILKLFAERLT